MVFFSINVLSMFFIILINNFKYWLDGLGFFLIAYVLIWNVQNHIEWMRIPQNMLWMAPTYLLYSVCV